MPEFYMIFARKINKIPEFYMICARKKITKLPEFYMIFARKIFFPTFLFFLGGVPPPPVPLPPSPTPMSAFHYLHFIIYSCSLSPNKLIDQKR